MKKIAAISISLIGLVLGAIYAFAKSADYDITLTESVLCFCVAFSGCAVWWQKARGKVRYVPLGGAIFAVAMVVQDLERLFR